MTTTQVNRTYKDSLFRMIFREKSEQLSLYNAINKTHYTDPDDLTVYTMEDVIYMGMKNDVAFLIGNYLNLYEAQSTINPNMPLRGVFYLSDLYRGYVAEHHLDIYSKVRLSLPTPQFIVFYNGTERTEERWTEYLSDSFNYPEGVEPALECIAQVYNINYGHNKTLMESCRKLYEYSYLVEEIRKRLRAGVKLAAAAKEAIEHCIQNEVLSDFLIRHRAEVTNMILTEYDAELHISSEKNLSRKEGFADAIIDLLEELGPVPDDLKALIYGQQNLDTLKKWHKLAAKADSLSAFQKTIMETK